MSWNQWIRPTWQNGCYDTDMKTLFRKNELGYVVVIFSQYLVVTSEILFTLPAGYRPMTNITSHWFSIDTSGNVRRVRQSIIQDALTFKAGDAAQENENIVPRVLVERKAALLAELASVEQEIMFRKERPNVLHVRGITLDSMSTRELYTCKLPHGGYVSVGICNDGTWYGAADVKPDPNTQYGRNTRVSVYGPNPIITAQRLERALTKKYRSAMSVLSAFRLYPPMIRELP